MKPHWDTVWSNVQLATMNPDHPQPYGTLHNAAIAIHEGLIVWLGSADQLPEHSCDQWLDGAGGWVTPGLIDCHTHLIFAGNRCDEFELRQRGASYQQIAEQGGGILSTVKATRAASEQQLLDHASRHLKAFLAEGVTSIEVKSGYGLNTETELRMLRIARQLQQQFPVTIHRSFLGAHALPEEFVGRADDYVELVCNEMIPAISAEQLADSVDIFCENIGFDLKQCERVFSSATQHKLPVRAHTEQLSNLQGSLLAANFKALSVDHLEHLDEPSIIALADSGTVATLLPAPFYFLHESKIPPIELLRQHQVPIAVASDFNPGSSPLASLRLSMQMAATLFGLSAEEVLAGVTRNAARALGLQAQRGQLKTGYHADLLLWDIDDPAELVWQFGTHSPQIILKEGEHASTS